MKHNCYSMNDLALDVDLVVSLWYVGFALSESEITKAES